MTTCGDPHPPSGRRRRFFLLAAGLLTLSAAAGIAIWLARSSGAPPTPPIVPHNENEPAVAAFLDDLRQRVLKEPRSARAWGSLGQAFLANEMDNECLRCFAEAERLDPKEPRWPYYQGGVLRNQGQPEAALPHLRHALERGASVEAGNEAPRLLLAETLLVLGQSDEAEEHFRQALERQPEDPRAHYGAALAASARRDWPASRAHLLHCVNSSFARKKASAQLAVVCLRLGDQAGAEKYSQQADHLPADSEWDDPFATESLQWAVTKKSRYHLAESLEAAGRLREAAAVLRPLTKEYPDDYLPLLTWGKILGRLGDNATAEDVLRAALRLAPDKVQGHHYLSLVLFAKAEEAARQGDHDRAHALYREAAEGARQALAVKPDHGFAFMTLGLSLKRLGQRDAALDALRHAVQCNPEYAELHFYLGEVLAESGERHEAHSQLQQAIDMAPPNAPWRQTALRMKDEEGEKKKE